MTDRRTLQAEGKHPAPCARHCEAKAFEIEIRGLKSALRARLEQQAEPVAWIVDGGKKSGQLLYTHEYELELVAPKIMCKPLYTALPQRKPLTDADIKLVMNGRGEEGDDAYIKPAFDPYGISEDALLGFVRAIEQAHGIGGKP